MLGGVKYLGNERKQVNFIMNNDVYFLNDCLILDKKGSQFIWLYLLKIKYLVYINKNFFLIYWESYFILFLFILNNFL